MKGEEQGRGFPGESEIGLIQAQQFIRVCFAVNSPTSFDQITPLHQFHKKAITRFLGKLRNGINSLSRYVWRVYFL